MNNTDGLATNRSKEDRYAVRLCRAVLLLGLGALMHLPGGAGTPPSVSPRPFVRVAAQQADSTAAPAIIITHSIVYAAAPTTDGVLQASDTGDGAPVGTAGVDGPTHAVALAEFVPGDGEVSAVAMNAEYRIEAPSPPTPDSPKATPTEKPLPAVAAPPSNEPAPPVRSPGAPAINVPPLPSSYRLQPVVVTARSASEEELVRRLLDEYTGAFERLDVPATKALYPTVDGKALKRAFEQIASQRLTLESCGITISGSTANARCRGSATFQPRIGTRPVQIASREWTFDLSKQDTSWRIVNTFVR